MMLSERALLLESSCTIVGKDCQLVCYRPWSFAAFRPRDLHSQFVVNGFHQEAGRGPPSLFVILWEEHPARSEVRACQSDVPDGTLLTESADDCFALNLVS